MKNKKILVTGGAGYIGSHVVRQLGAANESVITLDNLSTGFEAAVTSGELVVGDTGDEGLLEQLFTEHDIDTVMHFAAHTIVPESVADPLKYYRNNTANSRTLLEASPAARRQEYRFLVHRCGLWNSGRWQSGGRLADAANQSLRHLQTDDGVDAARPGVSPADPSYVALQIF